MSNSEHDKVLDLHVLFAIIVSESWIVIYYKTISYHIKKNNKKN